MTGLVRHLNREDAKDAKAGREVRTPSWSASGMGDAWLT